MDRTDLETMQHIWDLEEVKKLMAKRSYYIASDRRKEELADLWVQEEDHKKTASLGRNWGYYVGMDSIRDYYVEKHNKWLNDQKDENGCKELNIGNMYDHPCTTPLIEIAADGQTAKGMWYCIAQETLRKSDGTADARWMPEKLAADLIKENGQWKIWHLVIATDLNCEAGESYQAQAVYVDWDTDPVRAEFGQPDIEELLHDATFNWWDHYPFMPEAYETFTDSISYGPEGYRYHRQLGLRAGEGRCFDE